MKFTLEINIGAGEVQSELHLVHCVENAMRNNFFQYALQRMSQGGPSIVTEPFGPIDVKDASQNVVGHWSTVKTDETTEDFIDNNVRGKLGFSLQWLTLFIAMRCGVESIQYKALLAFIDTITKKNKQSSGYIKKLKIPKTRI
jgi:hypothetical protein